MNAGRWMIHWRIGVTFSAMMARRGRWLTALAIPVFACASAGSGTRNDGVSAIQPSTTSPAPQGVNPFLGAGLYRLPSYVSAVQEAAKKHPSDAALLNKAVALPTAIWLSWIADTKSVATRLDDAVQQQKADGQPVVSVFVLYDLPGRDCNAEASAGELTSDERGEARYQHEYIDVIAAAFRAHPEQRIAVVVEPDSLSNLVTNLENPRCRAVEGIYKRGIAYAITRLSLPNVFLYLDAAHAGWLGWPRNLVRSVPLYQEVLTMAGGADRIRGFATNVSNYDPVTVSTASTRNPAAAPDDELGYVNDLSQALSKVGITGKGFVIDTSRNGQAHIRANPGSWCNVKGAGLGERPRAAPAQGIDAYLYIKVPGESDGTSDPKERRFDQNCASDDATPGAPQAGELFDAYLINLIKNANPPL